MMMPHCTPSSITPTNCYLMELPKRAVYVKNVVQEEKETALIWQRRFGKMKKQELIHRAFGYSGLKSIRGY